MSVNEAPMSAGATAHRDKAGANGFSSKVSI